MQQENYEKIKYSKQISTIIRTCLLEYITKEKLNDLEIKIIKLTFGLTEEKMSLSEIMKFLNISQKAIDNTLKNLFIYFRNTKVGEYIGEIIYGCYELNYENKATMVSNKKESKTTLIQGISNIVEYFKSEPFNASEEIINLIIGTLSVEEIAVLKKRFGEDYQNPVMLYELSSEEFKTFKYILSKIEKRLQKIKNQMIDNHEYLISLVKENGLKNVELILRILIDEEDIQFLENSQSNLVCKLSDNEYSISNSILNINKSRSAELVEKITANSNLFIPLDDILYFLTMLVFKSLSIEYQQSNEIPTNKTKLFKQIYACLNGNLKYLECISVYYELKSNIENKKRLCRLFYLNKNYIEDAMIKFFDTAKYIIDCVKYNQREFKNIEYPSTFEH